MNEKKNLDKFRGCLIGGAVGDALGYAVEFQNESAIFAQYGKPGITEYQLHDGLAWISDDTQMTLFTANALLFGKTRRAVRGEQHPYPDYIANSYREWHKTQYSLFRRTNRKYVFSWLMQVPGLYASRAPGMTCTSAIREGCCGTMECPPNNSKGCGGVMRVAPIGLYAPSLEMSALEVDRLGAEAAALTHGHEMGYIPAAMLVHIVQMLAHNDNVTPKQAVKDSMGAMWLLFPQAETLPQFLMLMEKAVTLSESSMDDLDAIHALGAGWVGDEALAIAVYCALKYPNDFDKAMIAAVNHSGDSDSTGAIAGNILGAYLGLSGIPQKYLRNLELVDVLTEIADDLHRGIGDDEAWLTKYLHGQRPE